MIFVFIGMPGSGKGTQAKKLIKENNDLGYVAVGDILRLYAEQDSKLGHEIKDLMEIGGLIGDEIVNHIIINSIKDCAKTDVILDGYPRTVQQLYYLQKNFLDKKILIVYFKVRQDKLLNRLLSRIMCGDCGKIFSEDDVKALNLICDECNSKNLIRRKDDDRAIIAKRIEIFEQQTYPIIEDIKENSNPFVSLLEINGEDSIENINKVLYNIIKIH